MEFAKPITQNLKKFVKSLQYRKEREESSMFVAEGNKLCEELLSSSYSAEFVVVRSGAAGKTESLALKFHNKGIPVYLARRQQFDQITDAKSPQEILAVVNDMSKNPDYSKPFIALDGVNDPGNLGTIIRTADWFGFHNLIIGRKSVDRFNPKAIRSTMGSLFRCTITQTDDLAGFIREHYHDFELYGASLQSDRSISKIIVSGKFGIVLGSEAHGISQEIQSILTDSFIIPGGGGAESLNVAVSWGIIAYHFSQFTKK
jgi:TrmH family RNA methyltransferase